LSNCFVKCDVEFGRLRGMMPLNTLFSLLSVTIVNALSGRCDLVFGGKWSTGNGICRVCVVSLYCVEE
jgi:hypothetical protein